MQQRVAIARALAYQPSILLMDEPFASVDAQTRGDLEDLVLRVREEYGVTIVFVTHDIDESVYLSDRIVVLTHAPTEVKEIVPVGLPSPRDQIATKELAEFAHLRAHVYRLIKREQEPVADGSPRPRAEPMFGSGRLTRRKGMTEDTKGGRGSRLLGLSVSGLLAVVVAFGATAASAPARPHGDRDDHRRHAADRERAALDLGIKKGFFAEQGIEIKKQTLQSGNDIVLALANSNGDIGYLGYVPAMIARTQGIPVTAIAASEVEGTSDGRQLAEHPRQGLELDPDARPTSRARRSPSTRSRASARW